MIAKVVVHGPTRAIALENLHRVLRRTEVAGAVTNLAFLGALTRHAGFASGDVDTGLIGRDIDRLVQDVPVSPVATIAAAMCALGLTDTDGETGFTLWAPLHRAVQLKRDEKIIDLDVQVEGPDQQVWQLVDEQLTARRRNGVWTIDGQPLPNVVISGARITVFEDYGQGFDIVDPLDRDASAAGDTNVIEAPMPGLIKAVFASAGQAVREGERLAILEAMKMEHSLLAARDGVVAEVLANSGDQVEAGAALVRLEAD